MSNPAYHKKSQPLEPCQILRRPDGRVVPVKIGEFGGQGSGKSFTAAMLAIALSVQLHDRAPVYVYDTEPGWQMYEDIFEAEGVCLMQEPGESFDGLRAARAKAETEGACVFIGDSYTHIWNDLMKSFMGRGGFVDFQDWNQIKPMWRDWTREFINSPMHCFALGRLGWNYTPEEDERRPGKVKMVKSDSKFNAGGGESFGYEPHLLIELEQGRKNTHAGLGGSTVHIATVLKDRKQLLNGMQFSFDCLRGYRKGDYAAVWNAFSPHIEAMQTVKNHVLIPAGAEQGSKQVFGSDARKVAEQQRTITLEEITATMGVKLWPGQTTADKQTRLTVLEEIFGTRAWSRVEMMPLKELEAGLLALYMMEERLKVETPSDHTMLVEMLRVAKREVADSAVNRCEQAAERKPETITEVLLKKSIQQADEKRGRKPQPVAVAGD